MEKAGIRGKTPVGCTITGIAVCVATLLAGAFICAWLISEEYIKESSAPYAVMVITAVASVVGCTTASAMTKNSLLPVCIGTSAGFFLLLLAMTALVYDGQYQGVGESALLIIGIGAAVSLVKIYTKEKRKTIRKKGEIVKLYKKPRPGK